MNHQPHDQQEKQVDASNPITGFVAGTPILTPKGSKPIEEVKPGDLIVSKPDESEAQRSAPRWWEWN